MSLRPAGNKTGEKERRALVVEYGENDKDSHPADEGVLPQYKTRPSAGTESNCTYYCMTRGMNNSSCLYHFSIYFSHFQCIYCAAHFLLSVSSSCHHSLLSSVPIHNLKAPPRFLVDLAQSFHFFCSTTSIRAVACFLLLFVSIFQSDQFVFQPKNRNSEREHFCRLLEHHVSFDLA